MVQASVQLPNAKNAAAPHSFINGECKEHKDALDVVAMFDGNAFRLELVSAAITGLKCAISLPQSMHRLMALLQVSIEHVLECALLQCQDSSVRADTYVGATNPVRQCMGRELQRWRHRVAGTAHQQCKQLLRQRQGPGRAPRPCVRWLRSRRKARQGVHRARVVQTQVSP